MNAFPLIAKTFTGLEAVLADELAELGARDVAAGRRMVSFVGDQELLYRTNLWCRTAVRILKPIAEFELDPAADPARALYAGLSQIDWSQRLDAAGTLSIDPVVHGPALTNSLYAAQVAKDAIADWFRARSGQRPNVDRRDPDLRINLHVDDRRVTVYLDASGQSLHKRGYRQDAGEAPLNEVLAAGILRLIGWDRALPLVDFLCGSGTLPIEAALMARNIAPGTLPRQFGFMRWPDYDPALHARLVDEARRARRMSERVAIFGSDLDARAVAAARDNARRAQVENDIRFEVANFDAAAAPGAAGTIVINPPYDERLKVDHIAAFYRRLGDVLKRRWSGYTAWVFTGNLAATKQIGLKTASRVRLFNGPIECRLLELPLFARQTAGPTVETQTAETQSGPETTAAAAPNFAESSAAMAGAAPALAVPAGGAAASVQVSTGSAARALGSRLRRMGKHWDRWARRQAITCYRLYDRDIPEVPLSIDRYEDRLYVVEHARPHSRTPIEHELWFDELLTTIAQELHVDRRRIYAHARGAGGPPAGDGELEVFEAGHKLEVDLAARGDVGLPLDERELRKLIAAEASGKRLLNLFGRGGAASVLAAAGGAAGTLTVESSASLAAWSRRNLKRNGFQEPDHAVVQARPAELLERLGVENAPPFDLVLAAPPRSFHRQGDQAAWDARPEYLQLLNSLLPLVAPAGKIYFVTAVRRFRLDAGDLPGATIREITRQTTPPDFRAKPPHRSWSILRT